MKNHFTNRKYDFFRYGGKSSATVTSFNKRKDKYWFEKTSRKYSDAEIVNFLLANFVTTDNPKNLWIGEIINSGERTYSDWMKRQQSMSYMFSEAITFNQDIGDWNVRQVQLMNGMFYFNSTNVSAYNQSLIMLIIFC